MLYEVFPACVGMNRRFHPREGRANGVPRVCGDEPFTFYINTTYVTCSPRVWG